MALAATPGVVALSFGCGSALAAETSTSTEAGRPPEYSALSAPRGGYVCRAVPAPAASYRNPMPQPPGSQDALARSAEMPPLCPEGEGPYPTEGEGAPQAVPRTDPPLPASAAAGGSTLRPDRAGEAKSDAVQYPPDPGWYSHTFSYAPLSSNWWTSLETYLEVSDPLLDQGDVGQYAPYSAHSIGQLWVFGPNTAGGYSDVELGWIVDQYYFGDTLPHLFVAKNDNGETESINGKDFVPWSGAKYTVGQVIKKCPFLEYDGCRFAVYLQEGNWWLGYEFSALGYFPSSAFKAPFSYITYPEVGGEVYSSYSSRPCSQMGNGNLGTSQFASAALGEINLTNAAGTLSEKFPLKIESQDPSVYPGSILEFKDEPYYTGPGFFFGGPGYNTACQSFKRPTATTLAALGITKSEADLTGYINPEGLPATYQFEYGKTTSYGSKTPIPGGEVGHGLENWHVTNVITGLTPGATYHFRVVASSQGGTTYGGDATFKTTPQACAVNWASGSALQGTAHGEVWLKGFAAHNATSGPCGREVEGEPILEAPTQHYDRTASQYALGEFGDITGKLEPKDDEEGGAVEGGAAPAGVLDGWVGTEDAPTAGQIANASRAAPAASPIELTIPVAQAPIAVLLSLPSKCELKAETPGSPVRVSVENTVLDELWQGKFAKWKELLAKVQLTNAKFTASECEQGITLEGASVGSGSSYAFKSYLGQIDPSVWGRYAIEYPFWPGHVEVEYKGSKNKSDSDIAQHTAEDPGSVGYADAADAAMLFNCLGVSGCVTGDNAFTGEAVVSTDGGSAKHQILWAKIQNNGIGVSKPGFVGPAVGSGSLASEYTGNCATERLTPSEYGAPNSPEDSWSGILASDPNATSDLAGNFYPICALTYDLTWKHFKEANLLKSYGNETLKTTYESIEATVKAYLSYVTSEGQTPIAGYFYQQLPAGIQTKAAVAAAMIGV